jgi:hypothetical protein
VCEAQVRRTSGVGACRDTAHHGGILLPVPGGPERRGWRWRGCGGGAVRPRLPQVRASPSSVMSCDALRRCSSRAGWGWCGWEDTAEGGRLWGWVRTGHAFGARWRPRRSVRRAGWGNPTMVNPTDVVWLCCVEASPCRTMDTVARNCQGGACFCSSAALMCLREVDDDGGVAGLGLRGTG